MNYEYSEHAITLLKNFYMIDGETTPEDSFKRASYAFSAGDDSLAERILSYVKNGWFMFSSPILSNARLDDSKTGLPISCFLSYVPDTVEGLIDHSTELRWMSIMGGGVGGHWSDIRSVSNKAPGPIPFIKTVDSDVEAYKQGLTRKGSYATYIDVSHPDIIEFINLRVPTGGDTNRKCFNINNAVCLTDKFMNAVADGLEWQLIDPHSKEVKDTVDARDLWQRILEVRFRTGEPYFFFTDTANKALPEPLKQKGLKIHGSNLCIAGSDRVVTNKGYLTAQELHELGEELEVFDGVAMQKATAMQLIEKDVATYKITLKNGLEHTVTGYHKIKTDRGDIACDDLKIGDRVHIQCKKGLFGTINMEDEAFLLGKSLGEMPLWVWKSDETTQWQYVRGLFYADGTVSISGSKGEPVYLSITNVNLSFIKDLQMILRNLGMPFSFEDISSNGDALYRLVCDSHSACLVFEEKTNFLTRKGVSIGNKMLGNTNSDISEVHSIEYVGNQDVYCLTVNSEDNHFVVNGFITHNCNEIFLPTDKERSAVCCLSSLNLEYFDEWKDTTIVEDCITFLDNVLQHFIEKAPKQLHKAIYSAIQERSLGLGTMGFHSLLQKNNIAWESPMAKGLNRRVFKHIKDKAVQQTEKLAVERGEYLDGIGYGKRNSHLLAIAPNANSAIILNTSPSIEPWKSNAFTHRTRAGSYLQKNKYLDLLLLKIFKDDETKYNETWQSIILNKGSVQHLDFLTEYQKGVFKTAFELNQAWLIEHAADRQEFICQGQSLNLFFPAGSDKAYVNYVHILAWKKGLKGLYYLRTDSGATAQKISEKIERKALKDYDECVSCQG